MNNADKQAMEQMKNQQRQSQSNGQPPQTDQFPATPDPETLLAANLAQRRQGDFNKKVQTFLVYGYLQSGSSSINEVLDAVAVELVNTVLLPATVETIRAIPPAINAVAQPNKIFPESGI